MINLKCIVNIYRYIYTLSDDKRHVCFAVRMYHVHVDATAITVSMLPT